MDFLKKDKLFSRTRLFFIYCFGIGALLSGAVSFFYYSAWWLLIPLLYLPVFHIEYLINFVTCHQISSQIRFNKNFLYGINTVFILYLITLSYYVIDRQSVFYSSSILVYLFCMAGLLNSSVLHIYSFILRRACLQRFLASFLKSIHVDKYSDTYEIKLQYYQTIMAMANIYPKDKIHTHYISIKCKILDDSGKQEHPGRYLSRKKIGVLSRLSNALCFNPLDNFETSLVINQNAPIYLNSKEERLYVIDVIPEHFDFSTNHDLLQWILASGENFSVVEMYYI